MNKLVQKLNLELSEGRFTHSIGVAECAKELAIRFNCDVDKAYIAGLLHDCATKYSPEEMMMLALSQGLRLEEEISDNPVAEYHARLGRFVAKTEYGIKDPEILQAIEFHQLGGIPMTKLDMIISLADAIEPSRKGEKIDMIREKAQTNLLDAYIEKCALYISNTVNAKKTLPTKRIEVYNYLLSLNDDSFKKKSH